MKTHHPSPLRIYAVIQLKDGRWMARYDAPGELNSYYERSTYLDSEYRFVVGPTAPLVICLAALKAKGVNLDT